MHTLSSGSARKESNWVWQVFVPSLAYTSETVRLGMMTLAAMCKYFEGAEPVDQSSQYFDLAEIHGEAFVAQSRQQLHELQTSLVDSNSACSRLLCVLAFAFYRHRRRIGIHITDDEAWTWLHLLRGVQTVHLSMIQSGQALDPIILRDMAPEISSHPSSDEMPEFRHNPSTTHAAFDLIQQSRQERFQTLYAVVNEGWISSTNQKYLDLRSAVDVLFEVTEHICARRCDSLFRALCTFPGNLQRGFVEMVTTGVPEALIVYSHWLMLVVLAEDLWWVGDMGRAGILAVFNAANEMDPSWLKLLDWPLRLLDSS